MRAGILADIATADKNVLAWTQAIDLTVQAAVYLNEIRGGWNGFRRSLFHGDRAGFLKMAGTTQVRRRCGFCRGKVIFQPVFYFFHHL